MEKIVSGYVLRVSPYQENDCILTILLKDSGALLSFRAKGILKSTSKNAPSCQLYTLGEYLLDYKTDKSNNNTLRTGTVIESLPKILDKIEINLVLGLLCEGILKLEDSLEDEERLELFSTVFEALKTRTNYATMALVILKYFMLYCGVLLESDCCVVCGRKTHIVDVSYQEGGYICYDCNHHFDPHRDEAYLKNYRFVMKADIKNICDFEVPMLVAGNMLRDFFDYLENAAGLGFKSRSVIAGIL